MLRHNKTNQSPKYDIEDAFKRIESNPIEDTSINYYMNMCGMIYPLASPSNEIIEIRFNNMFDVMKSTRHGPL